MLSALAAAVLVSTGCERRKKVRVHDGDATRVAVAHTCTRDCHHHYYDGTRLVVLRDHRHGPGCGHTWNGKHWVRVKRKVVKPAVHVCTRDCHHHYYDGKKLVVLKNHRHRPGCGHRWDGRHWVRVSTKPRRP
jgi:hypothetical protein